jgi:hypothetical protein
MSEKDTLLRVATNYRQRYEVAFLYLTHYEEKEK